MLLYEIQILYFLQLIKIHFSYNIYYLYKKNIIQYQNSPPLKNSAKSTCYNNS